MHRHSPRFEGWYYKHQSQTIGKSLAVIPGRAFDSAFVLVITDNQSFHIPYAVSEYAQLADGVLRIGDNIFSPSGIALRIHQPDLALTLLGGIAYTNLEPINGDIMGPFRFFPMECRHGIISMNHTLHGEIVLNGDKQDYTGGKGYIESDSGRSFPKAYTWVQCNHFKQDCSIVASVARIPFYGLTFWGCICVVRLHGQEYRLATYKQVKILQCKRGSLTLKQGKLQLDITVDAPAGQVLPAPHIGKMSRRIFESLACTAHFRFREGDVCLFDEKSNFASYEYV